MKILRLDCLARSHMIGYDCENCMYYHECKKKIAISRTARIKVKITIAEKVLVNPPGAPPGDLNGLTPVGVFNKKP